MAGKSKIRLKKLTITQQAVGLRSLYPLSTCKVNRNDLSWIGTLQPTPLSDTYTIKLNYKLEKRPHIYVIAPQLIRPNNKKLPHVYQQKKQEICLYCPFGKPDWNPSMCIGRTIIPWASEWLFYYELWLATGEWLGGGIHISDKDEQNNQEAA